MIRLPKLLKRNLMGAHVARKLALKRLRSEFQTHLKAQTPSSSQMIRNTDDWVKVWIDPVQTIRDDVAKATAQRAITDEGHVIWMVFRDNRKRAFHANVKTPEEAFQIAKTAVERRRLVAKNWNELKELRRDILMFRSRMRPTLKDAEQAGLCDLGVQGFLNRLGLGHRQDCSGYLLAVASLFDRQIAYPLWIARARIQREPVHERSIFPLRTGTPNSSKQI